MTKSRSYDIQYFAGWLLRGSIIILSTGRWWKSLCKLLAFALSSLTYLRTTAHILLSVDNQLAKLFCLCIVLRIILQ